MTLDEQITLLQGHIDRTFHMTTFCPTCNKCQLERKMMKLIEDRAAVGQAALASPTLALSEEELLLLVTVLPLASSVLKISGYDEQLYLACSALHKKVLDVLAKEPTCAS